MTSRVKFYTVEYETEQRTYQEYFASSSITGVATLIGLMGNQYKLETLKETPEFEAAETNPPYLQEFIKNKNHLCEDETFHLGKLELTPA
mgnify:CR=1 FL=1